MLYQVKLWMKPPPTTSQSSSLIANNKIRQIHIHLIYVLYVLWIRNIFRAFRGIFRDCTQFIVDRRPVNISLISSFC